MLRRVLSRSSPYTGATKSNCRRCFGGWIHPSSTSSSSRDQTAPLSISAAAGGGSTITSAIPSLWKKGQNPHMVLVVPKTPAYTTSTRTLSASTAISSSTYDHPLTATDPTMEEDSSSSSSSIREISHIRNVAIIAHVDHGKVSF